jgi:hypothetical protein
MSAIWRGISPSSRAPSGISTRNRSTATSITWIAWSDRARSRLEKLKRGGVVEKVLEIKEAH